jgi:pimeloyl-ACP methyl ester carboxylesterase
VTREFPVFVPLGDRDHLAAVLTVPDGEGRGIVVLSTGIGAGRSHRFQVWSRLAAALAERIDVASIRFDYLGLHDSTGEYRSYALTHTPIDEMVAVASFARRALGLDRVVAAGNCLGAQSALGLAAEMPECVGAACLLPRITEPGGVTRRLQRVASSTVLGRIRRRPLVRRLGHRVLKLDLKTRSFLFDSMARALRHGDVVFVMDEGFRERMHRPTKLQAALDSVAPADRDRFELRFLEDVDLDRFGSIGTHDVVIDTLVAWTDQRLRSEERAAG